MHRALSPLCERFGVGLEIVEIDDDPALLARYGERVPVLAYGEREICQYVLDEDALHKVLQEMRTAKAGSNSRSA